MLNDNRCRALTTKGERCKKKASYGAYCGYHRAQGRHPIVDKIKTIGEVAVVATGIVEFVKLVVEVWQSIPFGVGPQMPDAYDALQNDIGLGYPADIAEDYDPFSAGADSVDWNAAKQIFDRASWLADKAGRGEISVETGKEKLEAIGVATCGLLETMQPQVERMVSRRVGRSATPLSD
jgi:hypothetical protein